MLQKWYKFLRNGFFIGIIYAFIQPVVFALPNAEGVQVYQKSFHLSAEHRQNLADDISRFHNADNLWDAVREELRLPHYEDNPLVQEQIDWFMNHQDFLMRSTTRAAPYLYYILQQAKKRHLPSEVMLLPIIESAYNPFAYSPAGAAGIWQMMPGTASGYGIKQNGGYDGRRDVIASTKAALNYLAYLSNFFDGNWLLAIASYDAGEGSVLSAIRKNIRNGENTSYWSLPLPQETRTYIPRLLALATIIAHPEKYPIYLPPIHNAPYLAEIDVGAPIDLKHAAYLAGIPVNQLWQLNPGYSRSTTVPHGPFKLILPIENVEQFSENLSRIPAFKRETAYIYKVRSGDTLTKIAARFYTNPSLLRQINQLSSDRPRPGTSLIIPHSHPDSNPGEKQFIATAEAEPSLPAYTVKQNTSSDLSSAFNNGHYQIQSGDTIYMTRNRDKLETIAKRFHTTPQAIQVINQLGKNKYLPSGQRLIIPTHIATRSHTDTLPGYRLASGDIIYMVSSDDSLEKIANKFHTTAPAIRIANLLGTNNIHEGDRLVIPTHV